MSSTSTRRARAQNADTPFRRRRDMALLGGLVLLVLAGLVGTAMATGWDETLDALTSLTVLQIVLLLALSLVNYMLRGLRWHLFSSRLGTGLSLLQNLRHFMGGFAMSVTPGRVGELVRMRWIGREAGWSFDRTAPLVLVDRASDLAAMAILLAIAMTFTTTGVSGAMPVVILSLILSWMASRPAILRQAAAWGHGMTLRRLPRLFARVRRAARAMGRFTSPGTMVVATFLGVAGWAAEGVAFHLLLVWMGADIGLGTAIAIFVFATLAGGLTGAPGGLGGAEAAIVALLVLDGVPLEIALPATLIIRVTTLWFAIAIGLGVFPWAERQSKKSLDALENS
ncbi:lysylphosphatidylglycerol synthase transmembrane domain-containing protein [Kangsaoukella pontilimi]|nr:lysylphosphatidylglycerol synthase transmembrane domain-containing protein [Kangsaoukella pontilimi]